MKRMLTIACTAPLLACGDSAHAQESAGDAVPDYRKSLVELPLKDVLAPEIMALATPISGPIPWHESLDAAKEAASQSGKPILLFQLLGRLDEEFC